MKCRTLKVVCACTMDLETSWTTDCRECALQLGARRHLQYPCVPRLGQYTAGRRPWAPRDSWSYRWWYIVACTRLSLRSWGCQRRDNRGGERSDGGRDERFNYSVFTKDTLDEKGQARNTSTHVTFNALSSTKNSPVAAGWNPQLLANWIGKITFQKIRLT